VPVSYASRFLIAVGSDGLPCLKTRMPERYGSAA